MRILSRLFTRLILCARQSDMTLEQEAQGGAIPPAVWPSREGTISVEGLTASYAPELPPVLKDVSFKVNPREKIGICGRTGEQCLRGSRDPSK